MRSALISVVAVAMLSGCGGASLPGGTSAGTTAVSPVRDVDVRAVRDRTWMSPESKRDDLLYVTGYDDNIDVFAYSTGKLEGSFRPPLYGPGFLCADSKGNVFVPTSFISSEAVTYEYAHGAKKPIVTLTVPVMDTGAVACSVDPVTGDLAVSLITAVAIFKHASGHPRLVQTPSLIWDCAYSNAGDLFAVPYPSAGGSGSLYELDRNAHAFSTVTLNERVEVGSALWVNGDLVVSGVHRGSRGPDEIYPIQIAGSQGRVGAPIALESQGDRRPGLVQFWIVGKTLVSPEHPPRTGGILNFWRFPQGGEPTRTLSVALEGLFGLTFSKAK